MSLLANAKEPGVDRAVLDSVYGGALSKSRELEKCLRQLHATRKANPYAEFNFITVEPNYKFGSIPPIKIEQRISMGPSTGFVEARRALQLTESAAAHGLDKFLLAALRTRPGVVEELGWAGIVEVVVQSKISAVVRETEFRADQFRGDSLGAHFDWQIAIQPLLFGVGTMKAIPEAP